MDSEKKNDIVDIDSSEYADDIEEIVISDYSDEEGNKSFSNSPSTSLSEIKISSVLSGKSFIEMTYPIISHGSSKVHVSKVDTKTNMDMPISDKVSDHLSDSSTYDSSTEGEEFEKVALNKSQAEKKRRVVLRERFINLWKAVADETSDKFPSSKVEILSLSIELIKQFIIKERKLEYSLELLIQTNYRLKRRIKRLMKRKKKRLEPETSSGPKKVVASRASV